MNFPFDPEQELILIQATAFGPSGIAILKLALDTGSTGTMLNTAIMNSIGFDPELSLERHQITTGSGVEIAPTIIIPQFHALGIMETNYRVLCHTFPPTIEIDGVLGVDFFRNKSLTIDFLNGLISVNPSFEG